MSVKDGNYYIVVDKMEGLVCTSYALSTTGKVTYEFEGGWENDIVNEDAWLFNSELEAQYAITNIVNDIESKNHVHDGFAIRKVQVKQIISFA